MKPIKAALLSTFALLAAMPLAAQSVPTPESVLGFVPGADRKLVEWPVLLDYYRTLAEASPRVSYWELGRTTNGAPFVALIISSEANMARLDEIREANAKLADPRLLSGASEREELLNAGKTIVLITSSIHSTEVGGHLSPTIIAHRLASESSPDIMSVLDNTVLLLVPSLNPDGVTIVSNWYNRTLGTPAEGFGPPELYHHYVGHDNNRDWYAFTQVETQMTIDSLHNLWHPQIVHDIHQQGSTGSRLFLPPFLDPIEPNVDPLIVQGYNTLGTYMAWELTGQGKKGIGVNSTYDAWTPARSYQHHHAGVRVLSETASARLATPIDVPFENLQGRRGYDAQVSSWNFPDPWPGGEWKLENIVDYQSSAAMALLNHAAQNRQVWLENFVAIGERAIAGWEQWPDAIVIPNPGQALPGLHAALEIMQRGMVEVHRADETFVADGREFPAGSWVIPMQQPYASFAKALLERQDYPDLRQYPGGPPRAPYDVTAHTLPLLMGFEAVEVEQLGNVPLTLNIEPDAMEYRYSGLSGSADNVVGLYQSHSPSMDEGWTRWIFEQWNIPHASLKDDDIRSGDLEGYGAIVIPDMSPRTISEGLPGSVYPEEYSGGLGDEGEARLVEYVEGGGTLVVLNGAGEWAIDKFRLPLRNVLEGLDTQDFYAPGTMFNVELATGNPLAANMPAKTAIWFQQSAAYDLTGTSGVAVVVHYPDDPDEILASGWVLHPERLAGKAAMVRVNVGRGRVIVFGFRPQYRAQSIATYPLFFNTLLGQ